MAIRIEQVSLDIRPCCDAVAPTVCARQGDEGMQLAVTVTDHGLPMQLAGLTATLKGEVPGYAEQAGTVDGSAATFSLGSEWTAHVGIHRPYVELRQGQSVVASTQCALLKASPGADASAGEAEEFESFIDQMKADYEAGIDQAEAAFDAALDAYDPEWPPYVRPTSKDTQYRKGDKITFEGKHYTCAKNNVANSPAELPKAWEYVEDAPAEDGGE